MRWIRSRACPSSRCARSRSLRPVSRSRRRRMRVVIIGGGMAGRRLAELLPADEVKVLGDEPSYDRTRLTAYVAGRSELVVGDEPVMTAVAVDRERQVVKDSAGREWAYDHLVFATGAVP